MSDIFICYSRTDAAIAKQLMQWFQVKGWSVFLDTKTRVGHRWDKRIEQELHAAKAVVVLWSAVSRDSEYVLEEAEYGKRKSILFPAFIESVEYPYGFGRIHTADLIDWENNQEHPGLMLLMDSLQQHFNDNLSKSHNEISTNTKQAISISFPASGQTFRDSLKIGGEGPLMVVIPAGRFLMGSPPDEPGRRDSEGPQHEVCIAKPFAMSVHTVTFDDYDLFCNALWQQKPEDKGWGRQKRPVIFVSWHDAQAYCTWLSEQTSRNYRLPSEAAWEYACRAGASTPFHTGTRINTEQANFDGNHTYNSSAEGKYQGKTLAVGTFLPNAFGLYDMHGNVWEWCQDKWRDNYQGAPTDGSSRENGGSEARVLRGGSWDDNPDLVRVSVRQGGYPGGRGNEVGFRVLCLSSIE